MAKTSILTALALVTKCAAHIGNAQAQLARESFNALRVGADTESVVQAIRDGAAVSDASVTVYVSQFRRLAAAPITLRDAIWQEREKAGTWVGFAHLLRVYDVPTAGKAGRKAKPVKADDKATPKTEGAAALETLPGLLLAFTNVRAAAPKATANGEALALMDQALALLRRDAAMEQKAKAAPL